MRDEGRETETRCEMCDETERELVKGLHDEEYKIVSEGRSRGGREVDNMLTHFAGTTLRS